MKFCRTGEDAAFGVRITTVLRHTRHRGTFDRTLTGLVVKRFGRARKRSTQGIGKTTFRFITAFQLASNRTSLRVLVKKLGALEHSTFAVFITTICDLTSGLLAS